MISEMNNELKMEDVDITSITSETMFSKVWNYVSNLPELKEAVSILDYAIPCSRSVKILLQECETFAVEAQVNTGGSEGVYIDFFIRHSIEKRNTAIGTLKTLHEGMDAYIKMGMIAGALIHSSEQFLYYNS